MFDDAGLDRLVESQCYLNLADHTVQVYQRGVSEHASCSCLWTGQDRYFADEARRDGAKHLRAVLIKGESHV